MKPETSSVMTPDHLTIAIPTHNRHRSLAAFLVFLERAGVTARVMVVDSSDEPHRAENRKSVSGAALSISYIEVERNLPLKVKLARLAEKVETPYCVLTPDEDPLFLGAVDAAVRFLIEHPDFVAAAGYWFTMRGDKNIIDITSLDYFRPSIEQDQPLQRIYNYIRYYQPTLWSVYRTDVMRRIFPTVLNISGFFLEELLFGALTLIEGKIARIPMIYAGRNYSLAQVDSQNHLYHTGHPLHWFINEPADMFERYLPYRDVIMESLRRVDAIVESEAKTVRLLDLIHGTYLGPSLDRDRISFEIEKSLGLNPPPLANEATASWRGVAVESMAKDGTRRTYRFHRAILQIIRNPEILFAKKDLFFIVETLDLWDSSGFIRQSEDIKPVQLG